MDKTLQQVIDLVVDVDLTQQDLEALVPRGVDYQKLVKAILELKAKDKNFVSACVAFASQGAGLNSMAKMAVSMKQVKPDISKELAFMHNAIVEQSGLNIPAIEVQMGGVNPWTAIRAEVFKKLQIKNQNFAVVSPQIIKILGSIILMKSAKLQGMDCSQGIEITLGGQGVRVFHEPYVYKDIIGNDVYQLYVAAYIIHTFVIDGLNEKLIKEKGITPIIEKITRRCNYYASIDAETKTAIEQALSIVRDGNLSNYVTNKRGSAVDELFQSMASITPGAMALSSEEFKTLEGKVVPPVVEKKPMVIEMNPNQRSVLDQFKNNKGKMSEDKVPLQLPGGRVAQPRKR